MPQPTRETSAGRVYNDLRNLARRTGRSTDELMIEYVLERFLYRVSASPEGRRHLVLKGGLLIAQLGARRMTRDIDVLGRAIAADEAGIIHLITSIAAIEVDDGVVFEVNTLRTMPIREDHKYNGLRLVMDAGIARARLKLQLDVSVGDPIVPEPTVIDYPQILADAPFQLQGYPIATVIAEKLTTAIALGDLNTGDRDYADLYRLITLHRLDGDELVAALGATAEYRGIPLRPLSTAISDIAARRQRSYVAWRRRQAAVSVQYPEQLDIVITRVVAFADPLLTGNASARTWDPDRATWA